MNLLRKIHGLSERQRKIILWSLTAVLAAAMLWWWGCNTKKRVAGFQFGEFIEQLNFPEIKKPKMPEFPDFNKLLQQNGTTTQEVQ
jgi:hypothetical protein